MKDKCQEEEFNNAVHCMQDYSGKMQDKKDEVTLVYHPSL